MKPAVIGLWLLVGCAACSSSVFAQRQMAVGPGIIPLNPTGVLNGVDMSGSGTTGTLSVGVAGGPETDIFTSFGASKFNQLIPGVSSAASNQGNIAFNSSSTVFGAVGGGPGGQPAGPFLLNISGRSESVV